MVIMFSSVIVSPIQSFPVKVKKKEPFTLDFTNPTPGEGDFIQILTSHSPEKKIFDYKSLFLHILQNR